MPAAQLSDSSEPSLHKGLYELIIALPNLTVEGAYRLVYWRWLSRHRRPEWDVVPKS